jgi:catechol 2,3-dioxygenase-like lactoylglutathione lyase family enzyme
MYLDYAGLRVTRLAPAIRFFERGLGLVVRSRGTMGHGGKWVLLEDPRSHQRVELNYYPPRTRYWTPFVPGEGLDHLGVRVGDLEAAGRKLTAAGARRVSEIRSRGAPVVVYYEGPDRIWIELILSRTE